MTLWLKKWWVEAVLTAVLVFLSTWNLGMSPATWFDEGINVGIAKSLVEQGVYSFEVAPHTFVQERPFLITTNYPVLLPVALSLKLFGMNFTAARLPMVLYLWAFALVAYLFARRLYGREAARWSVLLIITFLPFYGNGKAVLGEVPGLFFVLTALLLLPAPYHPKKLLLSGLFIGLAMATKPFFLLIPLALFLGEVISQRHSGVLLKRLIWIFVGGLVPVLLWLWSILPDFSLHSMTATLHFYANSYASSDLAVLIAQNLWRFVSESTPLHFLILFCAFASLLWQKRRTGEQVLKSEMVLGLFILLTLLFYLKTPGWYRYFFPAHLVLFLFFPAALFRSVNRRSALVLLSLFCIIQSALLVSTYDDPLYYSREAEEMAERIMKSTAAGESVLFINKPSVALLLKDRAVFQYLEINPVLHFGEQKPITSEGRPIINIYD